MFYAVTLFIVVLVIIAYRWAKAIDDMQNIHPDYKGEDFP